MCEQNSVRSNGWPILPLLLLLLFIIFHNKPTAASKGQVWWLAGKQLTSALCLADREREREAKFVDSLWSILVGCELASQLYLCGELWVCWNPWVCLSVHVYLSDGLSEVACMIRWIDPKLHKVYMQNLHLSHRISFPSSFTQPYSYIIFPARQHRTSGASCRSGRRGAVTPLGCNELSANQSVGRSDEQAANVRENQQANTDNIWHLAYVKLDQPTHTHLHNGRHTHISYPSKHINSSQLKPLQAHYTQNPRRPRDSCLPLWARSQFQLCHFWLTRSPHLSTHLSLLFDLNDTKRNEMKWKATKTKQNTGSSCRACY